jgi:hypothetical protein
MVLATSTPEGVPSARVRPWHHHATMPVLMLGCWQGHTRRSLGCSTSRLELFTPSPLPPSTTLHHRPPRSCSSRASTPRGFDSSPTSPPGRYAGPAEYYGPGAECAGLHCSMCFKVHRARHNLVAHAILVLAQANELTANPRAALVVHWPGRFGGRQVRVVGSVTRFGIAPIPA